VEGFVKKNVVMTAAAVLTLAAGAPGWAQTPVQALPQTPTQQTPTPAPTAPVQATAPFVTSGPRVDLSIEEAVARAREKNIDIAVARITPRLTDFSIAGLEANYLVNLTANSNQQRTTRLPQNQTQGIAAPAAGPGGSPSRQ
jgi:hypothetical protein